MSYTQARRLLAQRTLPQLLSDWKAADAMPITPERALLLKLLAGELATRDPKAFESWMANDDDANPAGESPLAWFSPA